MKIAVRIVAALLLVVAVGIGVYENVTARTVKAKYAELQSRFRDERAPLSPEDVADLLGRQPTTTSEAGHRRDEVFKWPTIMPQKIYVSYTTGGAGSTVIEQISLNEPLTADEG